MAFSVAQVGIPEVPGASYRKEFTFTGDTSYPNPAGYVLNAATFGYTIWKKLISVVPGTVAAGKWLAVVIPTYATDGSITSAALHLVIASTGLEVADTVNVSTYVSTLIVEGN